MSCGIHVMCRGELNALLYSIACEYTRCYTEQFNSTTITEELFVGDTILLKPSAGISHNGVYSMRNRTTEQTAHSQCSYGELFFFF
jgi:hypothetical protein